MHALSLLPLTLLSLPLATAHFTLEFPPPRKINHDNQPRFPCGGANSPSSSRTEISLDDPKLSILSEMGHDQAAFQVLLGLGNDVGENFNITLIPTVRQKGLGKFCLPDVSLDEDAIGVKVREGMNATLQVVTSGDPNGGLYQCADITFTKTDKSDAPKECSNGTSVTASPLEGDAAGGNANETSAHGGGQSGEDESVAVPVSTAAWGLLSAAFVGAIALM